MQCLFLIFIHNVATTVFKMTVQEFEDKLNDLGFPQKLPAYFDSKLLFSNRIYYTKNRKKIFDGAWNTNIIPLLLPKFGQTFFFSYGLRRTLARDDATRISADTLQEFIITSGYICYKWASDYIMKDTSALSVHFIAKVLRENFNCFINRSSELVITYPGTADQQYDPVCLVDEYLDRMFVYVPNDKTINEIFSEAAAKMYNEEQYEQFIDQVFEGLSYTPTTLKIELSTLIVKFNEYILNVDQFIKRPNARFSFSHKDFHGKRTEKIFVQIPQFYNPPVNDYIALLLNFFCIANIGNFNIPPIKKRNQDEQLMKCVFSEMFFKLIRNIDRRMEQMAEFLKTVDLYYIPFCEIDNIFNENNLNFQTVDFSRRVEKKNFKRQDGFFFVCENQVIFNLPNSPESMQRVDKWLERAMKNFKVKDPIFIENEFLDYLKEIATKKEDFE